MNGTSDNTTIPSDTGTADDFLKALEQFKRIEDYCDCDQRCPHCGRTKRPTYYGPIWRIPFPHEQPFFTISHRC